MPYSRTENRLLNLMADERNLTDCSWVKHAQVLVTYLEGRLMLYGAAGVPQTATTSSQNGNGTVYLRLSAEALPAPLPHLELAQDVEGHVGGTVLPD